MPSSLFLHDDDQDRKANGRRSDWEDGRQLIKNAWGALFAAIFQLAVAGFGVILLRGILDAPPAETRLDALIKFGLFVAIFYWMVWKCAGFALVNIGTFLHDRALGRHLKDRKGGWQQTITVGITVAVVTVYFNHHPEQLDALLAWVQQLVAQAQHAWQSR